MQCIVKELHIIQTKNVCMFNSVKRVISLRISLCSLKTALGSRASLVLPLPHKPWSQIELYMEEKVIVAFCDSRISCGGTPVSSAPGATGVRIRQQSLSPPWRSFTWTSGSQIQSSFSPIPSQPWQRSTTTSLYLLWKYQRRRSTRPRDII